MSATTASGASASASITSCGFCQASRSGSSKTFAHFSASPKRCRCVSGVCAGAQRGASASRALRAVGRRSSFMATPESLEPVAKRTDVIPAKTSEGEFRGTAKRGSSDFRARWIPAPDRSRGQACAGMTTFTFAHFATGSKKVRSGKRRRASDDAFGGHHDRHGQHRRKGARLLRGHQLPACGAALAPFQTSYTSSRRCAARKQQRRERLFRAERTFPIARCRNSIVFGGKSSSVNKLNRKQKEYSAFVLNCMAFLPPLVQTRGHATCSLTVASGSVGRRKRVPTFLSARFRENGRTAMAYVHTKALVASFAKFIQWLAMSKRMFLIVSPFLAIVAIRFGPRHGFVFFILTIGLLLSACSGSSIHWTAKNATLVSIGVTPANPNLPQGLTRQFTATGTYSDSSTQDLTAQVAWSSSNTGVATID